MFLYFKIDEHSVCIHLIIIFSSAFWLEYACPTWQFPRQYMTSRVRPCNWPLCFYCIKFKAKKINKKSAYYNLATQKRTRVAFLTPGIHFIYNCSCIYSVCRAFLRGSRTKSNFSKQKMAGLFFFGCFDFVICFCFVFDARFHYNFSSTYKLKYLLLWKYVK